MKELAESTIQLGKRDAWGWEAKKEREGGGSGGEGANFFGVR